MNLINDLDCAGDGFLTVTGSGIDGVKEYVQTAAGYVSLDEYQGSLASSYDCGNQKVISKEKYEGLIESERVLNALLAAGVDNWDGYDYAIEILETWKEEDRLRDGKNR
jgi:hypothetical protein